LEKVMITRRRHWMMNNKAMIGPGVVMWHMPVMPAAQEAEIQDHGLGPAQEAEVGKPWPGQEKARDPT
jgi:hypothetical protein